MRKHVSMKDWLLYGFLAPVENKKLRLGLTLAVVATGLTFAILEERRNKAVIRPTINIAAL